MTKLVTWAFALTMLAGAAAFADETCCGDPACCASGCCGKPCCNPAK